MRQNAVAEGHGGALARLYFAAAHAMLQATK